MGSADPTFRGDASLYNPEDLLLMALSACHMLSYLALCARAGIRVISYSDAATGKMAQKNGKIRFTEVICIPSSQLKLVMIWKKPAVCTITRIMFVLLLIR